MHQAERRVPWLLLCLAALAFLSQSCSLLTLPDDPGAVLFQDDFSRSRSGWDRYRDKTYIADYADGAYHILVIETGTDAWAIPHLKFRNVHIEVTASKQAGPDNNVFGLICRYQDPLNFYFFLISSDGYAGIGLTKDGRRKLISSEAMLPTSAIQPGDTPNHLGAVCEGYELQLIVNGTKVAEARAAEWLEGDVGLIAGTYDEPGADIYFDNFSVRNPD